MTKIKTKYYIAFCSLLLSMWLMLCLPVSVSADVVIGTGKQMYNVGDSWMSRVCVPKYDSAGNFTNYAYYVQDSGTNEYYTYGIYGSQSSISRFWTGFVEPSASNRLKYFSDLRFQFSILASTYFGDIGTPLQRMSYSWLVAMDLEDKDSSDYVIPNTDDYPYQYRVTLSTDSYNDGTIYYQSAWTDCNWVSDVTSRSRQFVSLWELNADNVDLGGISNDNVYLTIDIKGVQEQYEGNDTSEVLLPKKYRIYLATADVQLYYGYPSDVTADPWDDFTAPSITDNPYIDDVESRWSALTLPNLANQSISIGEFFADTLKAIWDWNVVQYICIPIGCTSISFYICKMVFFRR